MQVLQRACRRAAAAPLQVSQPLPLTPQALPRGQASDGADDHFGLWSVMDGEGGEDPPLSVYLSPPCLPAADGPAGQWADKASAQWWGLREDGFLGAHLCRRRQQAALHQIKTTAPPATPAWMPRDQGQSMQPPHAHVSNHRDGVRNLPPSVPHGRHDPCRVEYDSRQRHGSGSRDFQTHDKRVRGRSRSRSRSRDGSVRRPDNHSHSGGWGGYGGGGHMGGSHRQYSEGEGRYRVGSSATERPRHRSRSRNGRGV